MRLEWWKMGKNIQIDDLEKELQKAVKRAVNKKAKEKIIPLVKKVYKKHAEDDLVKIKAKNTAKKVKEQEIKDEAFAIADAMSYDKYIQSSESINGQFRVYNNTPPQEPLWGEVRSTDELIFTRWIVDGNIMIHPAMTQYKKVDINTVKDYNWKKYKLDYRLTGKTFVDAAIKDINKNYQDEIAKLVTEAVVEEITKI